MLLYEFFGKTIDPVKDLKKGRDDKNIGDDLFWYIVDHDKLHKEYFHPLARKIQKECEGNKFDKEQVVQEFLPMVNKGCKEYYEFKKMTGRLGKAFSEELRKDMCERLFDHYREDIIKGKYQLGT